MSDGRRSTGFGPDRPARILLVDDHPLLREGIARVLSGEADLSVVAEASDAEEGLEAARAAEPDLIVLDLALGDTDGLDLIPRIRKAAGDAEVLILSMYDERLYAERCLRAGASGYVMKEEGAETLLDAARGVLAGEIRVSEKVRDRVLRRVAGREGSSDAVSQLTDRELEVFRKLGEGASTRDVAESLKISIKTVETHRAKIMRKLDLDHAAQLVQRAVAWVRTSRRGS